MGPLLGQVCVVLRLNNDGVERSYHGLFGWDRRDIEAWEASGKHSPEEVELTVASEDLKLPDIIITLFLLVY